MGALEELAKILLTLRKKKKKEPSCAEHDNQKHVTRCVSQSEEINPLLPLDFLVPGTTSSSLFHFTDVMMSGSDGKAAFES